MFFWRWWRCVGGNFFDLYCIEGWWLLIYGFMVLVLVLRELFLGGFDLFSRVFLWLLLGCSGRLLWVMIDGWIFWGGLVVILVFFFFGLWWRCIVNWLVVGFWWGGKFGDYFGRFCLFYLLFVFWCFWVWFW